VSEPSFLVELLLLVAVAAVGVAVFERLRLPSIVAFLAMGALVGPGGLGLVADSERVSALAELGVVFLLFEIGLELPLDRVRRLWRRALAAGGLQVMLTLGGVAWVARALGVDWPTALVLGALVALSSTALVMGLLVERGEIDAPQGQLTLGILLFQDLCIVPFLLAVPLLAAADAGDAAEVPLAVARAVLALLLLFAAARLGLPRLLDAAARTRSREVFALLAFLVVLGSAVLAEELGLTLAVGAFIGGLALSASPYANQLFAEVMPLRGVLLGLFFTAVGMLVPFDADWGAVATFVACVVLVKAGIVAIVVALVLGQGARLGVLTGLALAQTGEFSFVLAGVAFDAGLLGPEIRATFVAGSVLTLAATPFLLDAAPRLAGRLARWLPERETQTGDVPALLSDHVVLVGFGLAGRSLARVLRARDIPYLVLEANPQIVQEARARGEPVVYGDATRPRLAERLHLERARLLVVAISDPLATRELVTLAHRLAPQLEILVRARYIVEVDRLEAHGATVVAEEYESTLELLAQTLRRFGVSEGAIARFSSGLREEGYELLRAPPGVILDPWLTEMIEESGAEWVEVPESFESHASLEDLGVRVRSGASVLAVDRSGVSHTNPPASFRLLPGDRLLALGTPEAIGRLRSLLARPPAPAHGPDSG
jgi:CPA2 family monovalent cation:H+ antiporter-2